jgi:cysteinyl-tRNA synthetase
MRFLLVDGGRMGKSLGNYVSFDDVLAKHSPDAFRYFYISTSYRRPLNFTWSALESAENSAKRLETTLDLIEQALKGPDDNLEYKEREEKLLTTIRAEKASFEKEMDDDFNSPGALVHLHAISGAINEYLNGPANKGVILEAKDTYVTLLNVLGLFESRSSGTDDLTEGLIKMIAELRQDQRNAKNYALADELRDRLNAIGVELQDTSEGTTWKINSN